MLKRAIAGFEKASSLENMDTLRPVKNLGLTYEYQRKLKEAAKMFKRALEGYTKVLGAKHSDTLQAAAYLERVKDKNKSRRASSQWLNVAFLLRDSCSYDCILLLFPLCKKSGSNNPGSKENNGGRKTTFPQNLSPHY